MVQNRRTRDLNYTSIFQFAFHNCVWLAIDWPGRISDHISLEPILDSIKCSCTHTVVISEAHTVDVCDSTLLEKFEQACLLGARAETRVGVPPFQLPFRNHVFTFPRLATRMEFSTFTVLNAMIRPHDLLNTGVLKRNSCEKLWPLIIRCERSVILRVPVARADYTTLKERLNEWLLAKFVNRLEDFIALGHLKRPTFTEVVLHVYNDECGFCLFYHLSCLFAFWNKRIINQLMITGLNNRFDAFFLRSRISYVAQSLLKFCFVEICSNIQKNKVSFLMYSAQCRFI